MYTNITLQGDDKNFNYIVEYKDAPIEASTEGLKYFIPSIEKNIDNNKKQIVFYGDEGSPVWKYTNIWYNITDQDNFNIEDIYSSDNYKKASINVYFPRFSIDIYKPGVSYAITFTTWIHDVEISLGTYILNRMNALAPDREISFMNEQYYEYIPLTIIDPKDILYGDRWENFRKKYKTNDDSLSYESILYISIHPVKYVEDHIEMIGDYNGGQNAINISHHKEDYLHLNLTHNLNNVLNSNEEPAFICELVYDNEYISLSDHLYNNYKWKTNVNDGRENHYGIKSYKYNYEFVIGHKDDIFVKSDFYKNQKYGIKGAFVGSGGFPISQKFTKSDIQNTGAFLNGLGYEEGMFVMASLTLTSSDSLDVNAGEAHNIHNIYLLSNKIPLTKELFKYFVGNTLKNKNHINLTNVNMNLYNVNVINKINQELVYVDNMDQAKSNIISPTFFRSVDSHDITIYKQVTENICINLDMYKSKVDRFVLKIGDVLLSELARTSRGIIFKVEGNRIVNNEGTYYILDQNYNMVTHGKYNCIL